MSWLSMHGALPSPALPSEPLGRRRKAAGATADAVLTALLEEKQQAVAQCEDA